MKYNAENSKLGNFLFSYLTCQFCICFPYCSFGAIQKETCVHKQKSKASCFSIAREMPLLTYSNVVLVTYMVLKHNTFDY